jgi:hypothetical protein
VTDGGDVWDEELGGVRLLSAQCSSCIGRPGNLMALKPGRLQDMVDSAKAGEGYITCHQTLKYGAHPDAGEALCRWFYDRYSTAFTQVMTRLGAMREVAPPGEET